jgi:hypothetical protein
MSRGHPKWVGFIPVAVVLAAGIVLVTAQAPGQGAMAPRFPIVRDWSHRYLAYGNASFRAATLSQLQRDPRLAAAWVQRNVIGALASASAPGRQPWRRNSLTLKRDWAVSLGNVDTSTPVPKEHFPAMWGASFTNPDCANDFVVFGIRAGQATGQANIVAFNNLYLYTTCSAPVPQTMWAYYVGGGGSDPDQVRTSPVLSLDGKEVAFVEDRDKGSGGAYFHVLKWVAGQGTIGSPATPGSGGSSVRSVKYSDSGNLRSSPFVDYWNNVAFVGADDGKLYAIGPVFNATSNPAVLGFVEVGSVGAHLTSPVMDPNENRIFISDGSSLHSYLVSYGTNSVTFSDPKTYLISGDAEAIQDAALVDVDRRRVFWFARKTFLTALAIETDYSFTSTATKTASIGQSSETTIRAGAFDDDHYSGKGGQLHVCGKASDSDQPRLYTFGFFQSGNEWVWNNSTYYVNTIATTAGECSPLTTFKSDKDRLFLGFEGGVIQMWELPVTSSADRADQSASGYNGGSAGIIVDNRSSTAEANNIYFQTVLASSACAENGTNKVCAVKLTQSGLQ